MNGVVSALLHRLEKLETQLDEQKEALNSLQPRPPELIPPSGNLWQPSPGPLQHDAASPWSPPPLNHPALTVHHGLVVGSGTQDNNQPPRSITNDGAALTNPVAHTTTTGSVLQSPPVKALLGSYPKDLFFRVESQRPLPRPIVPNPMPVDDVLQCRLKREITDPIMDQYFRLVHTQIPILYKPRFWALYERVAEDEDAAVDLDTTLILMVLAVGKAASEPAPVNLGQTWTPGVEYFTPAIQYIATHWVISFSIDVVWPFSLLLAAVYCSYLVRPLQSWRFCHMASTSLQQMWIRHESTGAPPESFPYYEAMVRLCWATFKLEWYEYQKIREI
jgi:hypothetical protein